jgi:hypothetical protein
MQVVCDLYNPAQQQVATFTRTSDSSGNLSVQVPGTFNSILGDFTLKCTTTPRDEDLEVRLNEACGSSGKQGLRVRAAARVRA